MAEDRRLYRSNDALIAGVCGGIAEYFSVSPTLVRTIAVLLLVLGIGAPSLIYIVLVLVVRKHPAAYEACVDVSPLERDYASGRVGAPKPPEGHEAFPSVPDTPVPPCPCECEAETDASAEPGFPDEAGADTPHEDSRKRPGAAYSATYSTVHDNLVSFSKRYANYTIPILIAAMALIFIAGGVITNLLTPDSRWWNMWPLIIVAAGCLLMFHKGAGSKRLVIFVLEGLLLSGVGCYLLACTTGVVGWNIWLALMALWPLFLVAFGIAIIGKATGKNKILCVATLALIGILVLGAYNYRHTCRYLTVDESDMFGLEQPVCPDSEGAQQYFNDTEQKQG